LKKKKIKLIEINPTMERKIAGKIEVISIEFLFSSEDLENSGIIAAKVPRLKKIEDSLAKEIIK
tara:strand:- start:351 stop:542 length:192 start_codon:yes stop_codon:yes gene_type:complete